MPKNKPKFPPIAPNKYTASIWGDSFVSVYDRLS
jgi:hypothetical protein